MIAMVIMLAAITAQAKPGPVILTFMERMESQTDASSSMRNISGETFMYSMVSAFRQLDQGVYGSLYYLNKFSVDDGHSASHIFGASVSKSLTGKWTADMGYSHSSNAVRNTVPSSDSDRFSFGLTFKYNPREKARKKWATKTTYSTGSDFSSGRTLSQKISASDKITKNLKYTVAYSFVYGLVDNPPNVKREHYSNQYTADFAYTLNKRERIAFGYMFLKNLFHSSGNSTSVAADNQLFRLSYFYTLR